MTRPARTTSIDVLTTPELALLTGYAEELWLDVAHGKAEPPVAAQMVVIDSIVRWVVPAVAPSSRRSP